MTNPIKNLGLATALCLLMPLTTNAAPVLPDFNAANFVNGAAINNIYFPMTASGTRIYSGIVDGTEERFELTNIGAGPIILGIQTYIQLDRAYEDDMLVEETFDYYAQDEFGNVWYFGEDVTNYEYDDDGNLLGTNDSSSWRAGANSALPGFIMPADLTSGFSYYQEFGPFDAAIDEAQTLASDYMLSLITGDYFDVLVVLETLATEPDARGIKYYVPGFGLIAEDEGVGLDFMSFEARIQYVETVPIPAAVWLLGSAIIGLAGLGRRTTRQTD